MTTPSSTTQLGKDSWLRSVMEKCILKYDESNFVEWDSTIKSAAVLCYLVEPLPSEPGPRVTTAAQTTYDDHMEVVNDVKNVLIWSMTSNFNLRFISLNAYEIFTRVTTKFSQTPQIRQYEAAVRFFEEKIEKGQNVGPHVFKMVEYVYTLERLECGIPKKLAVDDILHSLTNKFAHFRENYNMNNMDKSFHELHALLTQAERDMEESGSEKKRTFFQCD
ncbi:uncharacterized protein LOC141628028 [Silene latifolia]|uniref:uncharacterized protein LOC141628028 n=1 Tax=Silene latifolia TaxID=37657 RepID=UPI003D781540